MSSSSNRFLPIARSQRKETGSITCPGAVSAIDCKTRAIRESVEAAKRQSSIVHAGVFDSVIHSNRVIQIFIVERVREAGVAKGACCVRQRCNKID